MKKIITLVSLLFFVAYAYAQTRDVGITFEFANGELIIENSQEYYAFDIMVYADQAGTNFGSGMVYINYSIYSFGYNISAGGNIIVEKGDLIEGELSPGTPLYEIVNITDNSNSCVAITTSYNFPMLPDYGNVLPISQIQYLHIKIAVQNITGHSGLSFKQNLMQGQQYQSDDTTIYTPVIAIDTDNTDLPVTQQELEPTTFDILHNSPNPFGSFATHTSLTIISPRDGTLTLNIFNIKGQLVNTLYDDVVQKNQDIQLSWNGKDSQGNDLSSGIYLYQLLIENKLFETKKVVIIR